jgi:hypothetical protein
MLPVCSVRDAPGLYPLAGIYRPLRAFWNHYFSGRTRRTSSELIAQVIGLRRQLRPAYHIAQATGLSPATVSRILQRAQLNRWRHLQSGIFICRLPF